MIVNVEVSLTGCSLGLGSHSFGFAFFLLHYSSHVGVGMLAGIDFQSFCLLSSTTEKDKGVININITSFKIKLHRNTTHLLSEYLASPVYGA